MLKNQGILTINLAALRKNFLRVRQECPHARVGAAVKANGYGLGALEVANALFAEGCRDFFVSAPEEGLALREGLGESIREGHIYVLNGFYASAAEAYADHNLTPALGSFMEIENYKKLSAACGKKLPAYVSFNTRMNRLGLGTVETEKLLENMSMLDGIDVKGILSHFACADEKDHPLTEAQYEIFDKIAKAFPNAEKSLANSSGIFRSTKYQYDLVRTGAALYGLNPTPETKNPVQPVVSLSLPVMRVRLVYKGASVGYGSTHTFEKDTWIATVSAGYADGLMRSLSNKGALYWNGIRCPIRGRVSMDLTTVDLSDVPEQIRPRPGAMMELLGPSQDADALGRDAGTIGYEILTALGHRYKREYT